MTARKIGMWIGGTMGIFIVLGVAYYQGEPPRFIEVIILFMLLQISIDADPKNHD